jgi:hypothetical protein
MKKNKPAPGNLVTTKTGHELYLRLHKTTQALNVEGAAGTTWVKVDFQSICKCIVVTGE